MLKTCHVCKHLKTSKHPANIDQVTPVSSTFTRKITEEPICLSLAKVKVIVSGKCLHMPTELAPENETIAKIEVGPLK
jgi:hypothetical protein